MFFSSHQFLIGFPTDEVPKDKAHTSHNTSNIHILTFPEGVGSELFAVGDVVWAYGRRLKSSLVYYGQNFDLQGSRVVTVVQPLPGHLIYGCKSVVVMQGLTGLVV